VFRWLWTFVRLHIQYISPASFGRGLHSPSAFCSVSDWFCSYVVSYVFTARSAQGDSITEHDARNDKITQLEFTSDVARSKRASDKEPGARSPSVRQVAPKSDVDNILLLNRSRRRQSQWRSALNPLGKHAGNVLAAWYGKPSRPGLPQNHATARWAGRTWPQQWMEVVPVCWQSTGRTDHPSDYGRHHTELGTVHH